MKRPWPVRDLHPLELFGTFNTNMPMLGTQKKPTLLSAPVFFNQIF